MTFLTWKPQVEELLRLDTPFSEIEQQIDSAPLCDEDKDALWLYAWSVTNYSQLSEVSHGARTATFNTQPDDVESHAAPIPRKTICETPGFDAGYRLRRRGPKAISITIFDDADAGRTAAKALGQNPTDQHVGIEPDDQVEFFEVEPF
jgi:hypothetical protein